MRGRMHAERRQPSAARQSLPWRLSRSVINAVDLAGAEFPFPNCLRAGFKAGPVPAVAPALADGWSYWSARPLSTLGPGFADIHACDQAATEYVGMQDYSLGEHGAI